MEPPGGEDTLSKSEVAIERWKILRRALLEGGSRNEPSTRGGHLQGLEGEGDCSSSDVGLVASVRRFSTFGLLEVLDLSGSDRCRQDDAEGLSLKCSHPQHTVGGLLAWTEHEGKWLRYRYRREREEEEKGEEKKEEEAVEVAVKRIVEKPSLEVLTGFNNTGNVCVWPSEEILAYYCLSHLKKFAGASVCELGGGMTCLAGMLLACSQALPEVWLTDGNKASIDNVREIISANAPRFGKTAVSASVLIWSEAFLSSASSHDARYDYVISADCLFFEEVHRELAHVMLKLVKPGGIVLVFAPRRAGSLDRFCSIAREHFAVEVHERYDPVVWSKHEEAMRLHSRSGLYSPDLHYPLLLILKPLE